ncbi:hypothetical protein [Rhodoplanes sp. SY1]|uniref:hypothetical protein n=1 Tax=Rhodoplanes sp. SY1 TaxID=3166646 RepID=UPI0038B53D00
MRDHSDVAVETALSTFGAALRLVADLKRRGSHCQPCGPAEEFDLGALSAILYLVTCVLAHL